VGVNQDLVDVQEHGCVVLSKMEGVIAEPAPFMIIKELGDYNVLVRFFGWIDQRTADFAKVRGEAIRRVKLALDQAGVNMPEPAQTIRLQRAGVATLESLTESAARRETESVYDSPDTQLDAQINEDLADPNESNLLIEA
jgi:small-conductance mechanosensitive channel